VPIREYPSGVGGTYERLAAEEPAHKCRPPGWLARRLDHVKVGAIWICSGSGGCDRRWEWRERVGPPGGRYWLEVLPAKLPRVV
jgi:hypothetical protein